MRHARFGIAVVLLSACQPAVSDPDPSSPGPDVETACERLPVPDQFDDPVEQLSLRRAELIEGVLHLTFNLSGGAGGTETFLVRVDDDGAGEVFAERRDLSGFNPWVHTTGAAYAKMTDGFAMITLDASDPEDPIVDKRLSVDPDASGTVGYASAQHFGDIGSVGADAFYCRSTEDGSPQLMRIPLDEPPTNAFGEVVGALPCGEGAPAITAGSLWATWGGNRITTWDLTSPGSPTAAYQYDVTPFAPRDLVAAAFTDGRVVAAELEDDTTELLVYPPDATVHFASFGAPNVLLGVIDTTAFVVRPTADGASDEIVSFDLSNPTAPQPTDLRIEIHAPERTPSLHDYVVDSHDALTLVVHDANGQVYFVPRSGQGRSEPFRVARKTAAECAAQ